MSWWGICWPSNRAIPTSWVGTQYLKKGSQ